MRLIARLASVAPVVALAVACQKPTSAVPAPAADALPEEPNTAPKTDLAAPSATAQAPTEQKQSAAAEPAPSEPDGDGPHDDPGPRLAPEPGHFDRVGRHWGSLTRICDLQPFGSALYAAHGTKPLGWDGASITRYSPDDKPAFSMAFDWNRPGEPTKGGGGGQGFLRLRSLHDRLFTPDADPPYLGLGVKTGIEGYVFVSDANGHFAAARRPHHRPPLQATAERAGIALVPDVYHLFDVIEYQGQVYASGSVRGPGGTAPGALMLSADGLDFDVGALFPEDPGQAAWRLTYMVRFKDALLTGVEVLGGRGPDYVRWQKQPAEAALTLAHATPVYLTPSGGLATLRWYAHENRLYWIASGAGGAELRSSADGIHWKTEIVPEAAGAPLDLIEFGNSLVLLTERHLLALSRQGPASVLADIPEPSPFAWSDHYCSAPLAVFQGQLYAGGQQRGELYRFVSSGRGLDAP